jgi:predicted HTH transcriptional regulator
MKSLIGRPRKLTQAQIDVILAWHEAYVQWMALRPAKTRRQLARECGVSEATITYVIAQAHHYKQPPPEERARELEARRRDLARST